MDDTIVAISTALGVGAISIIRVSGKDAIEIVNNITKRKVLTKAPSHTIHYDHIMDKGEIIDEVLIMLMRAPKTYTMEDVVEINTHGGIATTNRILELLLSNGSRLAEPGEFTKRAFLNGRIDLIEAEGVMDLINAQTEKERKLAVNQITGSVSSLIENLRQDIIEILANIEVNIDYPEYEDIEEMTIEMLNTKLANIESQIKNIISESKNGELIKHGIKTAIVGRPNVGKSSLLNNLLETDKAIVTDIAGTTRDCVEGTLIIDGIMLNIIDTAGIRETTDVVEKIGVDKSINLIDEADLVLLVLNNNEKLTKEDLDLIDRVKDIPHIIIVNKVDLDSKIDFNLLDKKSIIYMSALNNEGTKELKNRIKEMFNLEELESKDYNYITNAKSLATLNQVLDSIDDIHKGIRNNVPIDMVEIDLKRAWELLGEIIGKTYSDELIDQLFSQFCLGK